EPAPRPYKGRVLAVDTTEAFDAVETAGVEPAPSRCKRVAPPAELRPPGLVLSRRERATDRIRTGTARITTSDAAVTPQPPRSGDDRIRTGDLSPDKRVLCAAELRPRMARVGFEPTVSSS